MATRSQRVLEPDDLALIRRTYHSWRDAEGIYEDVPGLARSATIEQVRTQEFVLTPWRYVDTSQPEAEGEPITETLARRVTELEHQLEASARLDEALLETLKRLQA